MTSEPPPIPPAPFKDRKTGLVVFGILTICIGAVCALFVPLMFLSRVMVAQTAATQPPMVSILPAAIMYAFLAIMFVWLGIGSINARRWARALLLVFAWSWLLMGTVGLTVLLTILPRIMAQFQGTQAAGQTEMPQGAKIIMIFVVTVMLFTLYIILPAILVLFYGRKDVKRTCELHDPKPRWTDQCPLPVLGLSLWLLFGALMMLVMPFAFHGIFPLFGMFLVGWPGTLLYLVLAALWLYTAWALYRLDRRGWWVLLVAMITVSISTFITYTHHDIIEVYRIAGYSEAQLTQIRQAGILARNYMPWFSLIGTVPLVLYLLYIRRFFRTTDTLPPEMMTSR